MKTKTIASITDYVLVKEVRGDSIMVENLDTGTEFRITGKSLLDEMKSADEFSTVESVTKTKLAEILTTSYNIALQVKFEKANGEKRCIRGRLASHEPLMGRSYIEDLDISDKKSRLRLVDHRTLEYVIVNGTKYVLA